MTKLILYFLHERAWAKLSFGLVSDAADDEVGQTASGVRSRPLTTELEDHS